MQKLFFTDRTKEIQIGIDNFLADIEHSGLIFLEGVKAYLAGEIGRFENYRMELSDLEEAADALRRDIKVKLYAYMLIPESRGDVLGLLETLDNVIDVCHKVMEQLSVEHPNIPDMLKQDFTELAKYSQLTVEAVANASRAFFTQLKLVSNFVGKVYFYEHEVDKMEDIIKRKIFDSKDLELSQKIHLRYFTDRLALPSDESEAVAERLEISAIKRKL
ncbi:MAG: DUF47 family protein [Candidatus Cloacimonetes bacterium]|nr:DUF47 family protein [Candidatus Cloacimonadota bacterium]